jgi:FtsP/CotA-like multicopper oxidase with cupredoxin domain
MSRFTRFVVTAAVALLVTGAATLQAQAAVRSYTLYATDGWVSMPDGNVMYVFGFNDTGVMGQVQFPAPLVWANLGDEVQINFVNLGFKYRTDLEDPHTVHLHGIHSVPYQDGFPELSFAIPMGQSFPYKFTADHEGTFMYHCHVEAVEHVQMGMYGPLVIYGGAQQLHQGVHLAAERIRQPLAQIAGAGSRRAHDPRHPADLPSDRLCRVGSDQLPARLLDGQWDGLPGHDADGGGAAAPDP